MIQLHLAAGEACGLEATCGTKENHGTEGHARKAAESLNRSGRARNVVEHYPCFWCNGWHIGRYMGAAELQAAIDTAEKRREQALMALGEAVIAREFVELPTPLVMWECEICSSLVRREARTSHMDWHDKVHAGLEELAKLLGGQPA